MIYSDTIVTPFGTAEAAPLKTIISITAGMLYTLKLYLPPGSAGLLHIQVFDAMYQIFPTTIGKSFSGDNLSLSFDENYSKLEPPYEMVIMTWNDDTEYDHELSIWFGFASKDEYIARFAGSTEVADLLKGMTAAEITSAFNRRGRVTELLDTFATEEK